MEATAGGAGMSRHEQALSEIRDLKTVEMQA
jgi:hypothetical protein